MYGFGVRRRELVSFDPSAIRSGAIFSSNPNYLAGWLCYINGIEVPIVGFTVEEGIWEIPKFQIHLVPDPAIQRLGYEDRVFVSLFYLDNFMDITHKEYRLLIDGEIVGYSYQSMAGQRVISYTCLAHINVFKALYFFFMNTVDDIVAGQDPAVQTSGITAAGLFYPYSLFHQGLIAPANTGETVDANGVPTRNRIFPNSEDRFRNTVVSTGTDDPNNPQDDVIKAPFELVYNVIRGIIADTVPADRRSVPAMNFFARYVRKTRLHQRFVRLPVLEDPAVLNNRLGVFPIFNAARNSEALAAMQRQSAGQVSNSASVWDMLQQVLQLVYMEICMLPAAPCVQANLDGEILGPAAEASVTRQVPPSTPSPEAIAQQNQNVAAVQAAASPITSATVANMVVEYLRASNALASQSSPLGNNLPTEDAIRRAVAGAAQTPNITPEQLIGTAAQWTRAWDGSNRGLPRIPADVLASLAPTLQSRLQGLRQLEQVSQAVQQPAPQSTAPADTTPDAATLNRQANAREGVNPQRPLRLAQYFVKPQFLFGIPPHCNVIFPSMVDNFSYSEDYLAQPTRLYVNDSVMTSALRAQGAQREFMLHALTVAYPEEAEAVLHQAIGGSDSASSGTTETSGTSHTPTARDMNGRSLLLWPEEFYKGPVVSRMSLPRWFQFLQQMRQSSGTAPAPSTQTGTPGAAATAGNAPANGATHNTTTGQVNPANTSGNTPTGTPSSGTAPSGATPTSGTTSPQSANTPTAGGPNIVQIRRTAQGFVSDQARGRIPYGGSLPAAWANTHRGKGINWWNDTAIRSLIERSVARMLPGANPYLLLGIAMNGSFNETTTGFITGLDAERVHPSGNRLIAVIHGHVPNASLTVSFHELGPFGVEGGSRAGPVPNSEGNNWWIRLADHADVRAVLGSNAPTAPGRWYNHPSQWVVGIKNQAERFATLQRQLGDLGPRVPSTTWAIALSAWAWSAGVAGAVSHISRIRDLYPQLTSVPEERRWTALLRFLADAYVQRRITNTPRSNYHNIYFAALRTQQKMRGGYVVAQATGGSIRGMDVLMGTDDAAINFLILQGAYNNHLTTPVRGGILGNSTFLQAPSFAIEVAPLVHRSARRVAQVYSSTSAIVTPEQREVTRVTVSTTPQATADAHPATPGAVPSAPPVPGAAPVTTVEQPPIEENSDASFQQLFRLYAQYEYLRQRYAARNAGVLLRFNPYVVVGFPCTVFDSMRTEQHITAYVISKTHTAFVNPGGQGTFDTQLGLSCVRTFPEFIQDVRNDCERFADRIVAAPAEIVDEIRTVIQNEAQAETLYRRLFYQDRPRPGNHRAAFVFTDAMGHQDNLTARSIDIHVRTETTQTTTLNNTAPISETPTQQTERTPATREAVIERVTALLRQHGGPAGYQLSVSYGLQAHDPRNASVPPDELVTIGIRHLEEADLSGAYAVSIPTQARAALAQLRGQITSMRSDAASNVVAPPPTTNVTTTTRRTLVSTLDPNAPLIPLPETVYATAFDNFHTAMQLASRPICTLTEYIRFLHGGAHLQTLIDEGIVEAGTSEMNYGVIFEPAQISSNNPASIGNAGTALGEQVPPGSRPSAVAYARIFKLRAGPGLRPSPEERGYAVAGTITAALPPTGVNSGYPQTRVDWDLVLRSYRVRVRARVAPGL